jgi:hypothetical protein
MSFRVETIRFRTRWMRTRFPFKYGIAAMTELPHVFLHLKGSVDGRPCEGLASEGLPPKWFTKDPETTFEEDLPAMLEVIRHAVGEVEGSEAPSVYAMWRGMYGRQGGWADENGIPPLLANLGASLVERAMIDAFCRGTDASFHRALHENALGIELEEIHPELAGSAPADWLPKVAGSVVARHTVGLGDPLRADEIPAGERADDGLPHSLEDAIDRYGLTHFKIKVCGEPEQDVPRLRKLAVLLAEKSPGFRFTLDGNEQFRDLAGFREQWEAWLAEGDLRGLLTGGGLLFVEQPLHRDVALDESVWDGFVSWPEAPPMIIDESDGELDSLRRALDLGYQGTSHKNCKGVFKGVANRCLIEWCRRNRAVDGPWLMSGEDLANVGPVALPNDLAVMAALGIDDVERNGHHYFKGLAMFPEGLQREVCAAHPDLYQMQAGGYAALVIEDGKVATESVNAAAFGCGVELGEEVLGWLGEEGMVEGKS